MVSENPRPKSSLGSWVMGQQQGLGYGLVVVLGRRDDLKASTSAGGSTAVMQPREAISSPSPDGHCRRFVS